MDNRKDTDSPSFLPPGEIYRRAHRIASLAAIAMDCTRAAGASRDVARATALLREISSTAGQGGAE